MIVDIHAEIEELADHRRIGWISFVTHTRHGIQFLGRQDRVGPWVARDWAFPGIPRGESEAVLG